MVIDTHVPSPPVMNDISPDTGASSTDGITDVEHADVFGVGASSFAVIELTSNGSNSPFGTTEADISGHWSYTVGQQGKVTDPLGSVPIVGSLLDSVLGLLEGVTTPSVLADGSYSVTATAMDIAGTSSAPSSPLAIVIDTQTPQAPAGLSISPDTGASSTDGVTTAHNLTISGTAESGDSVSVMFGGALLGVTTAGANGSWSYDNSAMTLPCGNYAITAQAVDVAGNVSPVSGTFNITIETVNSSGHRRSEPDDEPGGSTEPAWASGQTQQSLSVYRDSPTERPRSGLSERKSSRHGHCRRTGQLDL